MKRNPQLEMFKKTKLAYGGELLKTREGRSGPRPIDSRNSMHLVLRSSQAKGDWSFRRPQNSQKISLIIRRFAQKYGVKILSFANVGNHLHLHVKFGSRLAYKPFIRATTAAIAMAVTGRNRWTAKETTRKFKFWDYRPFTRVIQGLKALLTLRDYIQINRWEGFGVNRRQVEFFVRLRRQAENAGRNVRMEYG